MAWFIIQSERKTWTKYLVQAKDKDAALSNCDCWEYLGYVDGEDTKSTIAAGPFEAENEAITNTFAFIEG